ncbi:MAG: dialkylresorcinol condensing enzyme [Gammaproteobacteria bacterium]|nr:MAG: dialkylresorcinol condensing enzyme [Gammaproteobacteria bacterium]
MKKRKILVFYYSQSGQLKDVVDSVTAPLIDIGDIELFFEEISVQEEFKFPWGFFRFFDVFPECIALDAPPLNQPKSPTQKYDLIIFAYQVWFLSPSLPATALLQSDYATKVFKDTPVITLIGCRNMWLMAQEKVKKLLLDLGAIHIDNAVLVDRGGSIANFITVTRWLLTGKKNSLFGIFPKPGISPKDIKDAQRFGRAIIKGFEEEKDLKSQSMLQGYKAAEVDEKLIFSEKSGHRAFKVWSKLLRLIAPRKSILRYPFLLLFAVYLTIMIIIVVPIPMLIRFLISLSYNNKKNKSKEAIYFEAPSGSDNFNMNKIEMDNING